MRIALVYDMDACRGPTGVTRHALAQIEGLAERPDVALRLVSGRITEPDGLIFWDRWADRLPCHELPPRTRNLLRFWRLCPWPPLETWTGPIDWMYSPAEYLVPTRAARKAVTSHDVLQDLSLGSPRRKALLGRVFSTADLILSVSRFNTGTLLEAFPECAEKVAYVPNAADDLFFEPASESERSAVRTDLALPAGMPYLLSVANFQPRKNLEALVRAYGRVLAARSDDLALVLVGAGDEEQTRQYREIAAAEAAPGRLKPRVVTPGYRQGKLLRALYAEAAALVFPSLCESFGIPAVEAMAQGCPVILADSTALPEIAGAAGWYFDPHSVEALTGMIQTVLDRQAERNERVVQGRQIAKAFRWQHATERLVEALRSHS